MSIRKIIYLTLLMMLTCSIGAKTEKSPSMEELKKTYAWLKKHGYEYDIDSLIKKETIDLSVKRIRDISLIRNLPNLITLELYGNEIKNIDALKKLKNLKYLQLGNNPIKDITPLSKLTNLIELDLGITDVIDIRPLSHLINLEALDLRYTNVIDLSTLKALTKLKKLKISLSFINVSIINDRKTLKRVPKSKDMQVQLKSQVKKIKKSLPDCDIQLRH